MGNPWVMDAAVMPGTGGGRRPEDGGEKEGAGNGARFCGVRKGEIDGRPDWEAPDGGRIRVWRDGRGIWARIQIRILFSVG